MWSQVFKLKEMFQLLQQEDMAANTNMLPLQDDMNVYTYTSSLQI
jgi:hypothetical protein